MTEQTKPRIGTKLVGENRATELADAGVSNVGGEVGSGAGGGTTSKGAGASLPAGAVIDRYDKTRNLLALILLGVLFVSASAAAIWYGRDYVSGSLLLMIAGAMAGIGAFFLFLMLAGLIHLTSNRRSDGFYKSLVTEMGSGVLVTDGDGAIVFANSAYAELTGAEDASGISAPQTVFSHDVAATETIYRLSRQAKDGEMASGEIRLHKPLDPSKVGAQWFRLRARELADPESEKRSLMWHLSDITEDRRSQEKAFQELQNAISFLDSAPAGFFSSNKAGEITYLNATLANWLGVDLALFRAGNLRLEDFLPDHGITALNADTESGVKVIDLDLATGNRARMPVRLYHRPAAVADGSSATASTMVINRLAKEENDNALVESELRFTRFFNSTPMAIASVSTKGMTVRTNVPFMRMFDGVIEKNSDGSGIALAKLVQAEDQQNLQRALDEALDGNTRTAVIDAGLAKTPDRFLRLFVTPVQDSPGETDGDERVIVYAMETTEHRKLEEQFAQSQKMQAVGQLAGGIAHDFNNVLTAIIGFSDLLLANHRPSDPSFTDIMNIKQSANRAASLVRQLLAYSRRQTLRPQELQLSEVLSDLRMLLDRLMGEKVTLKIVHGRDLWPVKADLSQFEQVVVNLCVNGRDAMPEGGEMVVRTSNVTAQDVVEKYGHYREIVAADYVMLEVRDEGTGMSEEVMEKIFEPFFSTKEVGMGTGLGLATVYGIVKQTGGFVYPESKLGEGTTFRVFLPRHHVDPSKATAAKDKTAKEPGKDLTGNATILLVEDEDAVRAFGQRALEQRGYTVHEASSGVEALEMLEEYGDEIDLIVSDVVMPEMDGPTLFREVRKSYPDLKFIFVSGYAEEAFGKNLPEEERGNFGFLPKPFSLKQLATTVSEMLSAD